MTRYARKFWKQFRYGEKGFTLIELLVVIAILGIIAAVVVPNVGQFIGRGKTEAYAAELHNIQTAVMAMLADSDTAKLTAVGTATDDMSTVKTTDTTPNVLSDYLTGLDSANKVTTGCKYTFTDTGTVEQTPPS